MHNSYVCVVFMHFFKDEISFFQFTGTGFLVIQDFASQTVFHNSSSPPTSVFRSAFNRVGLSMVRGSVAADSFNLTWNARPGKIYFVIIRVILHIFGHI